MTVQVFENLLNESDRVELIDYLEKNNEDSDIRTNVTTKHPKLETNDWPKKILTRICEQVLDSGWSFENVYFCKTNISWPIHTDSGAGDQNKIGKNILIPLEWYGGDASTIVFKNRWQGPKARFMKDKTSRYSEFLTKKDGTVVQVEDIRYVEDISQIDITQEEFDRLKKIRTEKQIGDPRISDYSLLTDYDNNSEFDEEVQKKYMEHISLDDLHGLQIDKIIEWEKYAVYVWDRQQLHCSGSGHKTKSMIAIFTNKE